MSENEPELDENDVTEAFETENQKKEVQLFDKFDPR